LYFKSFHKRHLGQVVKLNYLLECVLEGEKNTRRRVELC